MEISLPKLLEGHQKLCQANVHFLSHALEWLLLIHQKVSGGNCYYSYFKISNR